MDPAASPTPIQEYLKDQIAALPRDDALEAAKRMAIARDAMLLQSNKFLIIGFAISILYLTKSIGVNLDIAILGTKIFEFTYGSFIFCVSGAFTFIISCTRYFDSRIVDRQLSAIVKAIYPKSPDIGCQSYISEHEWLGPSINAMEIISKNRKILIVKISFFLLGICSFAFFVAPIICCTHFLISFESNRVGPSPQTQWWIVLFCVTLQILFLISSFYVHNWDSDQTT